MFSFIPNPLSVVGSLTQSGVGVIQSIIIGTYNHFPFRAQLTDLIINTCTLFGKCDCVVNDFDHKNIIERLQHNENRIRGLEREFSSAILIPINISPCSEEDFHQEITFVEKVSDLFYDVNRSFELEKWGLAMEVLLYRVGNKVTLTFTLKKYKEDQHKCAPYITTPEKVTEKFFYLFGQKLGVPMAPSLSWEVTDPDMAEKEFQIVVSHFEVMSTNGVAEWVVRKFGDREVHLGPVFKTSEKGYLVKLDLLNAGDEVRLKVTFLLGPDDEELPTQFPHNIHVTIVSLRNPQLRHICQPHPYDLENGATHEFSVCNILDLDALKLWSRLDKSFVIKVYIVAREIDPFVRMIH